MAAPAFPDPARAEAIKRIKARRDFGTHAVTYVVVNAFLWILWAVQGGGDGFPWPLWISLGWGIGVVMNAWDVYGRKPITEADIERELHRGTPTG